MANVTSAPYFLHSDGENTTVPVSMLSLNTLQASEASVEPLPQPSWQQLHSSHHTISPSIS